MTKKKIKKNLEDFPEIPAAHHEAFETELLPNGELLCLVPSGHSLVCIMFDPRKVRSDCERLIGTMVARLLEGQKVDLANPGAGTYAELGEVEAKFGDKLGLTMRVGHYTETAWRFYMDAIISKLEEVPEQLMTQAMLATITEMAIEGSLNFKENDGVTKMWNCYLDSLKEKLGKEWNKPKPGTRRVWSPLLRGLLLDYYEARLEELTGAKDIYGTGRDEGWLKKAMEKYPNLDETTTERVQVEEPKDLARELTLKFLNRGGEDEDGEDGFDRQLRRARKERKAREAAKSAREADARHMYTIEVVDGRIRPRNLSFKKN